MLDTFPTMDLVPAAEKAPPRSSRLSSGPLPARAGAILEPLGMADRVHALPSELSGGQQQRVAIARALVHDPRLLVCDEPTAALDAQSGRTVMELLRRVAVQPGRAVIVVTHDNRVFEFGDRIVHMNDGRIERIPPSPADLQKPRPLRTRFP